AVVALESMGVPAPGETALVTAAIFAGTTHRLSIPLVIAAAVVGAIAGDNAGYWIGRRIGYALVVRYGRFARIDDARIRLGRFIFDRYGGEVVFFGRFVAVLRALAALFAGINRMPWWRFLFYNATGGLAWAVVFGLGGYFLGERLERLRGPMAIAAGAAAVVACAVGLWWMRRHEAELQCRADRAYPDPLLEH
ncbi:MAG: DedA family protein, partial [Acidobacteriota bacterium]